MFFLNFIMETLQERRRDFLLNKLNENNGIKEQISLQIAELKKKVLDPETITSQDLKNIYNYLTNPETKNAVKSTEYINTLDEIVKQVVAVYNKVKQYEKEQTSKQEQKPEPPKQPKNEVPETSNKPAQTVNEKPTQDAKPVENNNNNKQFSLKYNDFIKALENAGININNAKDGKKLIQNLEALNINLTE